MYLFCSIRITSVRHRARRKCKVSLVVFLIENQLVLGAPFPFSLRNTPRVRNEKKEIRDLSISTSKKYMG